MQPSNQAILKYDLLLKNGHVIDPKNNVDSQMDVAINDGKIAAVEQDIDPTLATQVVDVANYYVTPGLIDIHVHVHHTREPEGLSIMADSHSFRSGVTTMVDTGTAGAKHFLHFKRTVIDQAKTRIFAYVNIVDLGMLGDFEQDVQTMDPELCAATVMMYPDICVGVKTAHYWTQLPWDAEHPPWAGVDRAIEAAELCGKPVMYDFWPRPPERSYQELILEKARPGDIHTHVYAQQFHPKWLSTRLDQHRLAHWQCPLGSGGHDHHHEQNSQLWHVVAGCDQALHYQPSHGDRPSRVGPPLHWGRGRCSRLTSDLWRLQLYRLWPCQAARRPQAGMRDDSTGRSDCL